MVVIDFPEELRRGSVSDEVWDTTHQTWRELRPCINFNHFDIRDEPFDDYVGRIQQAYEIPREVLHQWIWPHYLNFDTVKNYGWIDYSAVRFEKQRWSNRRLTNLRIVDAYQRYVDEKAASFEEAAQFTCKAKDKAHWILHGTWRIPPVALDARGLGTPPSESDIAGRFQLVEGHTRMGLLRACLRLGGQSGIELASHHDVYVLRRKTD